MENNTAKKINVEEIMSGIREEIRRSASAQPHSLFSFYRPKTEGSDKPSAPLLYAEELNYLNANWHNWNTVSEITSHRKITGSIIVKVKRKILDLVWNYLFRGYFERERQFQMQLVRHLNATARYIDARDKEIFWNLIDKLDNDIQAVNDRVDRLFDSALGTVHSMEIEIKRSLRDD